MDINDERYLEQIRKKLYSRNIISIEEYDAILNFFRKHKEERDIQLLFHNDIPIEIKQHYLEICWEMIQCDPLLIEKMPYGVIYDNNGIINIVRRHPETIKYLPKRMIGLGYPKEIYQIVIEKSDMQPNLITAIPEKYLRIFIKCVKEKVTNNNNIYYYLPPNIKNLIPKPKEYKCYHLTKKSNLLGIMRQGLQPQIGTRSGWMEEKENRVYYSIGEEAFIHMSSAFDEKTRYMEDLGIDESIYLVFREENIGKNNEDDMKDSYTVEPIQSGVLKVCIIENIHTRRDSF